MCQSCHGLALLHGMLPIVRTDRTYAVREGKGIGGSRYEEFIWYFGNWWIYGDDALLCTGGDTGGEE